MVKIKSDSQSATMTGGKHGSHTIYRSGESIALWAIRIKAHWLGYLGNQKGRS